MLGLICGLAPGHLFLWQVHVLNYILHYRLASKLHVSQSTQQNFSVHRDSSCTRLQNVWYGCVKAEAISVAKHVLGDLSKSCRLWALPQCKFAASTFGSSDIQHYLQRCVHVFLSISTCTMLPLVLTEVQEVCFWCMQLLNKCPLQQLGCPMLMSCAWSIKLACWNLQPPCHQNCFALSYISWCIDLRLIRFVTCYEQACGCTICIVKALLNQLFVCQPIVCTGRQPLEQCCNIELCFWKKPACS